MLNKALKIWDLDACTSSQLYSTQYGIIFIHIGTLAAFSHIFCYFFFLIQATTIQFSIIIKVRSQHAVPVVRQTSDRGQKIIRQWSGNHQAVVRQSIREPVHNCWFCIRYLAKNTVSFWFKHEFDRPSHRLKGLKCLISKRLWVWDLLISFIFLIPCLYKAVICLK